MIPMIQVPLAILSAAFIGIEPPAAQPASPAAPEAGRLTASTVAVAPSVLGGGGPIANADDLLIALERTGADIRTLEGTLRYTRTFGELEGGDAQVREGRLLFVSDPPSIPAPEAETAKARRRFEVDFTSTIIDNARHADEQTFIFDGEWFIEKSPEQKQIIKRQVVPKGQSIDPLAIGEGPFPIPIGQKRDRILERFEASLAPPGESFPAGTPPEALRETWQLRLVPRRGTDEARQYREVRIWYRKDDLLPRMARTTDKDDSSTEIFLTSMKLNAPLPKGAFDTTTPEGWDQEVREFRKERADE